MTSENTNKTPTFVPPTPSTPLPSSAFTTPDRFRATAQRQKQRAQELNINLNTVPEMQNETNEDLTNQNQNSSDEPDPIVDNNCNETVEEMKQKFDLFMLQMEQENQQLRYSLNQTQQENAYLQYQQRLQYQQPVGQQLTSPVPINYASIAGKPEYFTGDYKSNPETWIDQICEFMKLSNVHPQMYVTFAASYLRDQARIWWSSMSTEDRIKNQDFYIFKQTLLSKYRPVNQQRTARTQLKTLKQLNSVASYNNAFSNVIQLIHDMSVADQLDNYMNGLKIHIQEKLVTEEFTSLSDAMNAAARIDTLLYNKRNGNGSSQNYTYNYSKPKHSVPQAAEVNNVQTWPMGQLENNEYAGSPPSMNEMNANVNAVRFTKLTPEQREQLRREGKCFKCRQHGHMANTCPTNVNRSGISSSHSMKPSAPISNTKKY